MSVVKVVSPDDYKLGRETLRATAASEHITIPPGRDEDDYLLLLNSIDGLYRDVAAMPEYVEPALQPCSPLAERKYWKAEMNPLNAWSHVTSIPPTSPGPLSGKSVVMKDNMSLAGVPITCGTYPALFDITTSPTSPSGHPISIIDASIVPRILAAGATIAGVATCENFSMSPLSYTSATGPVQNPWLPAGNFTTGGSTSGGAALVGLAARRAWLQRHGRAEEAAQLAATLGEGIDLAIGGDQGGSIRMPASYCGIYGLKPTFGLVPYTGIASLHPFIDTAGPLATSLPDLAALLSTLAGYDGLDARMSAEAPRREHVPDYAGNLAAWIASRQTAGLWTPTTACKGLKIGVLTEAFASPFLAPAVAALIRSAADQFAALGATVVDVSVPLHTAGGAIWTAATRGTISGYSIKNAPSSLLAPAIPGWRFAPPSQTFYDLLSASNPAVVTALLSTAYLNSPAFGDSGAGGDIAALTAKAYAHVFQLRAAYDAALAGVDALLLPVNNAVGVTHPQAEAGGAEKGPWGLMRAAIGATANTAPFNATGHPGLVIPAGWGEVEGGKLPVGMQLVGKRWDEAGLLRVAAAWEVGGLGLDK